MGAHIGSAWGTTLADAAIKSPRAVCRAAERKAAVRCNRGAPPLIYRRGADWAVIKPVCFCLQAFPCISLRSMRQPETETRSLDDCETAARRSHPLFYRATRTAVNAPSRDAVAPTNPLCWLLPIHSRRRATAWNRLVRPGPRRISQTTLLHPSFDRFLRSRLEKRLRGMLDDECVE